ncbi:MAG: hypothetical protein WCT54_01665 [Patescibacteria group bacterium]|jgi:hypothetical protein
MTTLATICVTLFFYGLITSYGLGRRRLTIGLSFKSIGVSLVILFPLAAIATLSAIWASQSEWQYGFGGYLIGMLAGEILALSLHQRHTPHNPPRS